MILVLGKSGQVARQLKKHYGAKAFCAGRELLDFNSSFFARDLAKLIKQHKPTAIINAVAYTAVDKAETEQKLAYQVNAVAVGAAAQLCAEKGINFVHYSSDYVYSGEGVKPWQEDDTAMPKSVYAASKLKGDQNALAAFKGVSNASCYILRTSWVYDENGNNFANTMLKLGQKLDSLRIVGDQIGAPTYAQDLAIAANKLLNNKAKSGVYHCCNTGYISWYEFAEAIFAKAKQLGYNITVKKLESITTEEYPTPANRPKNSRLCLEKINQAGVKIPTWQNGLDRFFAAKK